MTDKEKILAKIESLLSETIYEPYTDEVLGRIQLLKELKSYIESLQEEHISEELEKAADKYSNHDYNYFDVLVTEYDGTEHLMDDKMFIKDAFIEGAKWKEQQMMSKAIDAQCFGFQGAALFSFRLPADNYLVGSEIKVIVIKED